MLDTPFTTGKAYRQDELGNAAVQRANWRYAAFASFGLSGLLILLLFYTVSLPRKIPVPITINEASGEVRVVQEDWKTYVPPDTAYTAQLRNAITVLRTVTLDKEDMRRQHVKVRAAMTLQGKKEYNQKIDVERKPF